MFERFAPAIERHTPVERAPLARPSSVRRCAHLWSSPVAPQC